MQMDRLTSAEFDKMIIESIDEVYCLDKDTDDILFFFDQIRSGEITSESDVVYAEGRQGVQLAAFDRNKTAGFTCENGYVQAGAIAVQLGSDLQTGAVEYEVMETLKSGVDGNGDPTGDYALGEKAEEITKVYLVGKDGSASTELVLDTDYTITTTGDNAYKEITVDAFDTYVVAEAGYSGTKYYPDESATSGYSTNVPQDYDGDAYKKIQTYPDVLVHYKAKALNGKKIVNSGDKFSKNIKLVINFVAQEPCGSTKYLMQCVMPNAKASGTFSLSAGDNPAVHNFEASALLDVCSIDKELFYIVMV